MRVWILVVVVLLLAGGGVLGLLGRSLWRRTRLLLGELGRLGGALPMNSAGNTVPPGNQAGSGEGSEA